MCIHFAHLQFHSGDLVIELSFWQHLGQCLVSPSVLQISHPSAHPRGNANVFVIPWWQTMQCGAFHGGESPREAQRCPGELL